MPFLWSEMKTSEKYLVLVRNWRAPILFRPIKPFWSISEQILSRTNLFSTQPFPPKNLTVSSAESLIGFMICRTLGLQHFTSAIEYHRSIPTYRNSCFELNNIMEKIIWNSKGKNAVWILLHVLACFTMSYVLPFFILLFEENQIRNRLWLESLLSIWSRHAWNYFRRSLLSGLQCLHPGLQIANLSYLLEGMDTKPGSACDTHDTMDWTLFVLWTFIFTKKQLSIVRHERVWV